MIPGAGERALHIIAAKNPAVVPVFRIPPRMIMADYHARPSFSRPFRRGYDALERLLLGHISTPKKTR